MAGRGSLLSKYSPWRVLLFYPFAKSERIQSEKRIVFQTGSFVAFASTGVEFALQTAQNFFDFKKGMVIKMRKFLLFLVVLVLLLSVGCESAEPVFREFIVFNDTGSFTRTLATPDKVLRDGIPARVKVVGILEERAYQYPYTVYQIQITDDYHGGEKLSGETVYTILFVGTPSEQMYRQPPLEIGREYVVLNLMANSPVERTFEASYWFDINTVDGEEYIYPYFLDCSGLESKIPITDSKENAVYKEGRHDEILKVLKKRKIENPTFDYKFKIKDFIAEITSKS